MQLQRSTWALLMTAILLSGVVYLTEFQRQNRQTQQAKREELFTFTKDDIIGLKIETASETFVFRRNRDRPAMQQWQMTQPDRALASTPAIEFLLDLLVESKVERRFPLTEPDKPLYGLEEPIATITIDLVEQNPTAKILLGSPNFDEKSIYAQVNPDAPKPEVKVIPIEFQYAIERDREEWLDPDAEMEEDRDIE
jgi:hypothetical protein